MNGLLLLLLVIGAAEIIARRKGFLPRRLRVNPYFAADSETAWSTPDPELGWVNKPGVARSIEFGHASMTFWDFSRRASRPALAPPPGPPVMVIGGSTAQAYGVRDEDSFVYLLGQRFPQLWFENFGTGGYSTVQAMLLAERALKDFYLTAKPQLILLAFDDSHILRNVADQSWVCALSDRHGRYLAPPHYRLLGEALHFRRFRALAFWPLEKSSALVTWARDLWIKRHYSTAGEALAVTSLIVDRLANLARDHGSQFAVAILEDRSGLARRLFTGGSHVYLDCSQATRNDPLNHILQGGHHPNARLHAYFAAEIGNWLQPRIQPKRRPQNAEAAPR